MTRTLRRAHFSLWLVISAGLIAVFLLSLPDRREAAPHNPDFHWSSLR